MHLSGVLGAIIPSSAPLRARTARPLTTSILSIGIRWSRCASSSACARASSRIPTPLPPKLRASCLICRWYSSRCLLHDIGKGHGHDHHERGASLTAEVSQRLGLNSEEIDLVVFLERNHLMMSQVAQKGDLDDQTTVAEFARTVGSIDRPEGALPADLRRYARGRAEGLQQLARHAAERSLPARAQGARARRSRGGRSRASSRHRQGRCARDLAQCVRS